MVNKPVVISHPASFKLCQDFYKNFMGHKASTSISEINELTTSDNVKKYFENNEDQDLNELLAELNQTRRVETPEEFFLMSYKEIVTTNSTGDLNE